MIDLTRLMFDDGATRAPLQTVDRRFIARFRCGGKDWTARIIGPGDLTWSHVNRRMESERFYGWWFHTGTNGSDYDDLERFLRDPDAWCDDRYPGWYTTVISDEFARRTDDPNMYTNGYNVLVRFEEVV